MTQIVCNNYSTNSIFGELNRQKTLALYTRTLNTHFFYQLLLIDHFVEGYQQLKFKSHPNSRKCKTSQSSSTFYNSKEAKEKVNLNMVSLMLFNGLTIFCRQNTETPRSNTMR